MYKLKKEVKPLIFDEKPIATQLKFSGIIINVRQDVVTLNNDSMTTYREVVEHPGGVCIAAVTDEDKFLLVEQFRYAQKQTTLEFVAGKRELNEHQEITALRELEEETGYVAQNIEFIGEVYPSPAYLDEKISLYFAKDLIKTKQNLDHGEFLRVVELSLDDILHRIVANEIKDLKTIALAYEMQRRLLNGKI